MRLNRPIKTAITAGLCTAVILLMAITIAVWCSPRPSLTGDVPFSTAYYDRNGKLLRLALAADDRYRLPVTLDNINPALITATLTQEDRFFYHHPGVNPFALLRAVAETYLLRSRTMGGSTITMQLVRLRDDLNTRTIPGKITQIMRALQIERHYAKDKILTAYLNLAPYGGNIHGAGTASLIYFHRPAATLAPPQSVALAVIPQNPVKRAPFNTDRTAWDDARTRLYARLPKTMTAPYNAQSALPLPIHTRADLPFAAPHMLDTLAASAPTSGIIRTTLDADMQQALEQQLTQWLARHHRDALGTGAAMLVHAPTMDVRALIGSVDFYDRKVDGQVDGTAAPRSPGSTLKPFIYALALEQGLIHPETLLDDDPTYFAEYRPGNFDDRFIGKIPAREALALSRNVPAIALAARINEPDLYGFLQSAAVHLPQSRAHYGLSLAVGGAEITMRDLIRLYAMLANGGTLQDLRYTNDQSPGPAQPLLSPEAALLTLTMIERENPARLPYTAAAPLPIYWKTGTSSGFRDAWTVGVFGDYVLAVWLGHFDGRGSAGLIGADAAAPLFFTLADTVIARTPGMTDRIHPALAHHNLARIAICRRTGMTGACGDHSEGWFIPGKSPFAKRDTADLEILSPRAGIAYVHSRAQNAPLHIPLEAKLPDNHTGPHYWFADNRLIGTSTGKTPLFWSPPPGEHTIRIVAPDGRAASQTIHVMTGE